VNAAIPAKSFRVCFIFVPSSKDRQNELCVQSILGGYLGVKHFAAMISSIGW